MGFLNAIVKMTGLTAVALLVAGCSGDLGLNDFKGACEKDSDCPAGYQCTTNQGCVLIGVPGSDGGGPKDGGADADGSADAGSDAGRDAGWDGGAPADAGDGGTVVDAGILLRYNSIYDTAAGAFESQDFKLKAVTGWSTGPRWISSGSTLQPGQPWGQSTSE